MAKKSAIREVGVQGTREAKVREMMLVAGFSRKKAERAIDLAEGRSSGDMVIDSAAKVARTA
jgi:hypothetical protein